MAFTSRRASQRALMTVTGGLRIPQLLGFLVGVVVVVVVAVVVVVVIDEELRGNVV